MTLTSHYTKASGSETKKRKVRDANVFNTNLSSPRRDDVGDGRLVSQLFVEAEMLLLAPFCETDPTGSQRTNLACGIVQRTNSAENVT